MLHQLQRLAIAFWLCFAALGVALGYWAYAESVALTARADNPRYRLAERYIGRGTIFDRTGAVLAQTTGDPGQLTRYYPYPRLAPILGYVSPFYGVTGLEAAADSVLHGGFAPNTLDEWFSVPPAGRDIKVTIDLQWQTAVDQALGERTGAVVVLNATNGDIVALASHPTFDPNALDDQFDALLADPQSPLLNRATQTLYQPGGVLYPLITAGALKHSALTQLTTLTAPTPFASASVPVGNFVVQCRATTNPRTVREALDAGCPYPFAQFGQELGAEVLEQLLADFRLYSAPEIALPTIAATRISITDTVTGEAIGQGALNVTPLHVALVTAAFANRGELPAPRLVVERQNGARQWEAVNARSHPLAALPPEVAQAVLPVFTHGYSAHALTNNRGDTLAWFMGVTLTPTPYAVVVLLENAPEVEAQEVGQAIFNVAAQLP